MDNSEQQPQRLPSAPARRERPAYPAPAPARLPSRRAGAALAVAMLDDRRRRRSSHRPRPGDLARRRRKHRAEAARADRRRRRARALHDAGTARCHEHATAADHASGHTGGRRHSRERRERAGAPSHAAIIQISKKILHHAERIPERRRLQAPTNHERLVDRALRQLVRRSPRQPRRRPLHRPVNCCPQGDVPGELDRAQRERLRRRRRARRTPRHRRWHAARTAHDPPARLPRRPYRRRLPARKPRQGSASPTHF